MIEKPEHSENRTTQQNRALHKWFTMVAEELNGAGLDIRKTLKEDFEIPWSSTLVKEILWRETQKIALGKDSTTELEKKEIDVIYEILNRFLAKHEIHVPWPAMLPPGPSDT